MFDEAWDLRDPGGLGARVIAALVLLQQVLLQHGDPKERVVEIVNAGYASEKARPDIRLARIFGDAGIERRGSQQSTRGPVDNVPIDNVPIDNVPIDNVPIDNVPIDNVPIDKA